MRSLLSPPEPDSPAGHPTEHFTGHPAGHPAGRCADRGAGPPGAGDGPATVVLVRGAPYASSALAAALPPGWGVRVEDTGPVDVVVLCSATPAGVRLTRREHPESRVVAVVTAQTAAADVIDVLSSGADACIRGGDARVLAAHLLACGRRMGRPLHALAG